MAKMIKVALAGAFGIKHLDGIKNIDGVEVVSLVGQELDATGQLATEYGIPHLSTDLAHSLAIGEVDAVILCTPTQLHAAPASACLEAGKHVQVEIPLADSISDAQAVVDLQKASGLIDMCGRFTLRGRSGEMEPGSLSLFGLAEARAEHSHRR